MALGEPQVMREHFWLKILSARQSLAAMSVLFLPQLLCCDAKRIYAADQTKGPEMKESPD